MIELLSKLSRLCTRSDEEVMSRVKTNDDHVEFAVLVKRWESPIRRLCTRIIGDLHRADDLKQETFVRLFEKRKEYQPIGRFSTYLWRIALNLCYDELRRQERRRQILSRDLDEQDNQIDTVAELLSPDVHAARSEEGALVRQALMQLPEIYRTVLVLRHYEGLKLSQIAEVLEIPEGTVNSRMAEALCRLARILEPQLREDSEKVPLTRTFIKQRPVL